MPSNARILVVDDDPGVRAMLADYLGSHGHDVVQAEGGAAMRAALEAALPDIVLLDIRLAGEDGLALARWLRERYDVGIIMVTASGDVVDRVVGLEVGADDYIAKPFDPRELLARIKSLLRRVAAAPATPAVPSAVAPAGAAPGDVGPAPPPAAAAAGLRAVGRCRLDLGAHRLFDEAGGELPLTAMEFDLLTVFIDHPNRVLSRDQLLTLTRNREWEPFDRSIDIRIARLRRKVEPDPEHPRVIRTVRGSGYMFVPGAG
jgi:two-component system phosphate regulon response regulator OmpR